MSEPLDTNPSHGLSYLYMLAAFAVVVGGLRMAQEILQPFLLAIFIAVISVPSYAWLVQHKLAPWLSLLIVISAVVGLMMAVSLLVMTSLADFTARQDHYSEQLRIRTLPLRQQLARLIPAQPPDRDADPADEDPSATEASGDDDADAESPAAEQPGAAATDSPAAGRDGAGSDLAVRTGAERDDAAGERAPARPDRQPDSAPSRESPTTPGPASETGGDNGSSGSGSSGTSSARTDSAGTDSAGTGSASTVNSGDSASLDGRADGAEDEGAGGEDEGYERDGEVAGQQMAIDSEPPPGGLTEQFFPSRRAPPRSRESWQQLLMGQFDPATVIRLMVSIAGSIGYLLSNGVLILLTVVLILLEASSFPGKLSRAFGTEQDPASAAARERYLAVVASVRSYMALKTWISLLTGLFIWVWLWFFGVPYAAMWGMLAFLLNFVPNVGSIIAAIPALLVAWLDLGWMPAIACGIGYLAVNMVVGNIIEPRVMGRGMGLSPLVVFCSMVFWGWVLGPVGMLTSVPLTMAVRVALEGFDDTRWLGTLLGN